MSISIDLARKIVEASKQRAKELRSPVSITIVDAGGHLVLFERMMAPYGWATGNISIAKASTAVMFNQPTDAVAQWGSGIPGFASSLAAMTQGKFIMAAGGWPLRVGGTTIGGIGVSGGNAPGRDDEIARAGLGILETLAPPLPAQSAPASPESAPASIQAVPPTPRLAGAQQAAEQGIAQQHPAETHYLTPDPDDPYNEDAFKQHYSDHTGGQS